MNQSQSSSHQTTTDAQLRPLGKGCLNFLATFLVTGFGYVLSVSAGLAFVGEIRASPFWGTFLILLSWGSIFMIGLFAGFLTSGVRGEHRRRFIAALKHEYWDFRRKKVAKPLGRIGGFRVVEALIGALKSEYSYTRQNAAWALKRMTGKDFGQDPVERQRWWERNSELSGPSKTKGPPPSTLREGCLGLLLMLLGIVLSSSVGIVFAAEIGALSDFWSSFSVLSACFMILSMGIIAGYSNRRLREDEY